jgi:hypothetical protein
MGDTLYGVKWRNFKLHVGQVESLAFLGVDGEIDDVRRWQLQRRLREFTLQVHDHHWFENRGPACSLIAYLDDATGRILIPGRPLTLEKS